MFQVARKFPVFCKLIPFACVFFSGCVTPPPPSNVNNVCHIFKQYPHWYTHALDVQKRWLVPIPIQMAIIHQESKFNGHARPKRKYILGVVPSSRPSSAYGYAQALNGTWGDYKKTTGGWPARNAFADGVDFIGWYADIANQKAGISRRDPYSLYLAYHEGVGGFQRKTYLRKPWLIKVAKKVKSQSEIYRMQLSVCEHTLKKKSWWKH